MEISAVINVSERAGIKMKLSMEVFTVNPLIMKYKVYLLNVNLL